MRSLPFLNFCHANGFPAKSYNKLFSFLSDDYNIIAIDKLGHRKEFPVIENWDMQVLEVIQFIENHASSPIFGVGHSLGALVTFLAAQNRPDIFHHIVLIEPPIVVLPGFSFLFRWLKKIDLFSPAAKSKFRRQHWNTREEATAYFKRKPFFQRFDSDCLDDYIQHGLSDHAGSITLEFLLNVELAFYRTTPHHLKRFSTLKVPGTVVLGEFSDLPFLSSIKRFVRQHKLNVATFSEGGHMFPFESPERTGNMIKNILNETFPNEDNNEYK